MDTRTKNDIARWLVDRVAQGEREEIGSMDSRDFQGCSVIVMKGRDNEFPVWLNGGFCPDFILAPGMTEGEVRKIVGLNA